MLDSSNFPYFQFLYSTLLYSSDLATFNQKKVKWIMSGNSIYTNIKKEVSLMKLLWWIIVILIIIWLAGLLFKIAGGVIHILIVIAIILVIYNLITGRKKS